MFSTSSDPPEPEPTPTENPNPAQSSSSLFPNRELTLSYLCEPKDLQPPTQALSAAEAPPLTQVPPAGADAAFERDFLLLSGSKRHGLGQENDAMADKKAKVSVNNNSLDLSLSLNSVEPTRQTNNSESYGVSYSCSVPFSHNPSCSLTSHCDWSSKNEAAMYHAGEGTNGSVHSRFRPIGDGTGAVFVNVAGLKDGADGLSRTGNNANGMFFPSELPARALRSNVIPAVSNDGGDGFLKTGNNGVGTSISFVLSEQPARSVRSNVIPAIRNDGQRDATAVIARPDKVLREIVSGSVLDVAQMLQEFSNEQLELLRETVRALIKTPEKKDEFASIQRKLERRADLNLEVLGRCHRTQLEILVAIKTGLVNFVKGKGRVPSTELVEMFLQTRCPNLNCMSVIPVDGCDCKICSSKKGFCSACMCAICFKFDSAAYTCGWVGCDVCSHLCHTACGLERNSIRPGPATKRAMSSTEMQFQCLGCDHVSEMYEFVKEVFNRCAKDWSRETLMKETDYVRRIFAFSEDFDGKGLHAKAEEVLTMLARRGISTFDAAHSILEFFKYGITEFSVTGSSKGLFTQESQAADILSLQGAATSGPSNVAFGTRPSNSILDTNAELSNKPLTSYIDTKIDVLPASSAVITVQPNTAVGLGASTSINDVGTSFNVKGSSSFLDTRIDAIKSMAKPIAIEPRYSPSKDDDAQSLETIVKCKEAEAKLFQKLSDDARRELENYCQMIRVRSEKLEEEYDSNVEKLCLPEMEEQRRKKLEEVKVLENSHHDYLKMKMRMQAEIARLFERMEATRKLWS